MTGYPVRLVTPVTDPKHPDRHFDDDRLERQAWATWRVTYHGGGTRQHRESYRISHANGFH